jgi:hypothetical protein
MITFSKVQIKAGTLTVFLKKLKLRKCTGFIMVVERLVFMNPAVSSGVMEVEDILRPVTLCQLLRNNFSLRIWLFSAVQFHLNL